MAKENEGPTSEETCEVCSREPSWEGTQIKWGHVDSAGVHRCPYCGEPRPGASGEESGATPVRCPYCGEIRPASERERTNP